jgi:hypothetical protein
LKLFTISFPHNSFLWLPSKTASTTLSWILYHFDFENYNLVNEELSEFVVREDRPHFGHEFYLPPNHREMSFIVSTRHPYDRIFSFFKMNYSVNHNSIIGSPMGKPKKEFFEEFVNKIVSDVPVANFMGTTPKFSERLPDYIVKSENLYTDLLKIPFIRNSDLNKYGFLEKMCKKRLNKNIELDKNFYFDKNTKQKIYNFMKKDFEIYGYNP